MYRTNTARYAQRELDILVKTVDEPIIAPFIPEILALCEKFGNSGQSGGSAPYAASALAQAIKKLCLQDPICDITGHPDEWGTEAGFSQNIRCSALFRQNDGKAYYLDAVVFKTERGAGWSGTALLADGSKVYSRQYVKGFPFKPKTFYIDVIEKEAEKDNWEFYVKDESQLEAVFKYYDRF